MFLLQLVADRAEAVGGLGGVVATLGAAQDHDVGSVLQGTDLGLGVGGLSAHHVTIEGLMDDFLQILFSVS